MSTFRPVVMSAHTIMGDPVRTLKGEKLGQIEDVTFDLDSGRIAYGIVSLEEVLGTTDRFFAVPWQALQWRYEDNSFTLDADPERLKDAPHFEREDWPDMADHHWETMIHSFYGARPYWE
ncbi:MAG: PRC-barrel domain-containing protein [Pirellulales bacterium]